MKQLWIASMFIVAACGRPAPAPQAATAPTTAVYLDYSGRDDVLTGGVKMVPDQKTYFAGVVQFIEDVDAGRF